MSNYGDVDSSDSEPRAGPSSGERNCFVPPHLITTDLEDSPSDSEIDARSTKFDPLKALYSNKVIVPNKDAPIYENIQQFESSLKCAEILTVGASKAVKAREEKKKAELEAKTKELEEFNKKRFAKFEAPEPRKEKRGKNVFTRVENAGGPLQALRKCLDDQRRVKVTIRDCKGVGGVIHGNLQAFDKHWNLLLSNVIEVSKRKARRKLKIPPAGGRPVPQGTANLISPLPDKLETPIGRGLWEIVRHLPSIIVRGEHIVLINILDS